MRQSVIGVIPPYTLGKAVLGMGYVTTIDGVQHPDISLIPETPITTLPGQFKEVDPVYSFVDSNLLIHIDVREFGDGESFLYNTVGIKDSTGEIVLFFVGQSAHINATRPLDFNVTLSEVMTDVVTA
jgi:hypothetical protein